MRTNRIDTLRVGAGFSSVMMKDGHIRNAWHAHGPSIRGAALAGDGREAQEERRLLADLVEDLRAGEAGDVVCHGEGGVSAPAFCMHPPLGDHLAVEMRHLLHQPDVLQQRGAARTGGHDIGVVGDRRAGRIGENL